MKPIKKFLFLLCIFYACSAMCQTRDENLKFGDDAFADGDYYSASTYYFSILQQDTSDVSIAFKYAESCRLFNDYKSSEKWYAYVSNSSKSKEYPLALFYLALMNKSNGRYSEARNNFYSYYNAHKSDDNYFKKKAKKLVHDTIPVLIEHLSQNVNSPYDEFGALQLGDTALIYSALRPNSTEEFEYLLPNFYLSEIYRSKNTMAGWSKSKELPSKIDNKETNNANIAYSPDHKRMYFSRCSPEKIVDMKCAIYFSEFKSGKWQEPVKLNNKINLDNFTSTQPAVETLDDGNEVLYFVSDRPGGIGKNDIWYSIYKNGKYSDPVNLGNIVNTPGDEISPYYYNATKTLYFSSDWHNGLGGYDIFKTKGNLNEWAIPQNMGFPINTSYNDLYFTVNEVDTDGYFTSNRPGSFFIKGETCCNDIWSYEWQKPKVIKHDTLAITQPDTINYERSIKDLLPLTLYFHNDIPDPASPDTLTKLDYKTTLADYIDMREIYEDEYSKGLRSGDKTKAIKDIDEFFDDYVAIGFSKLEQMSQWLLKDLQKGKNVKITVKGFCSPLQTSEYNIRLAKRRISSLINYFRDYNHGVFVNYINGTSPDGGKLEIHEDPVGKSQANSLVSDNPYDQRNSIYSRAAALERKIQIIMYQSGDSLKSMKKNPEITFIEDLHDFGKVAEGEKKVFSFTFQNTGQSDLIISGVETSCGCTISDFPKDPILPGAKGQINILFDSKDELGKKEETITVYSNTLKPKKELTIVAEVIAAPKQQAPKQKTNQQQQKKK
jgi:hypothetical protein